jgi:hypothetical protein
MMDDLRLHGLIGGGGLKSFFGDGSDGTIPNLTAITTAPNGGTVANLWDMNAGTLFTTGTLSSASDQVVFSIDFGKPFLFSLCSFWQLSISTGTRVGRFDWSDDGITWTSVASSPGNISTTPLNQQLNISNGQPHRYYRFVLQSGGSNCTLSAQGFTLNFITGDVQTNRIFRIVEPSTLNGGAVIKQYVSYNLPWGYEHTVQNPCQGLVIYSQGDVNIGGSIDMSQKAGLAPNGNPIPMIIAPSYIKTAKTSSLLHFDNNITDAGGRAWSQNGTIAYDATNKKFGTHAINFNGAAWIDTPASDDFSFGSEDFTIEAWVRPTTSADMVIYGTSATQISVPFISVLFRIATNKLQLTVASGDLTYSTTGATNIPTNVFTHVVAIRQGDLIKLFVNGSLDGQGVFSGVVNRCLNKPTIGRYGESAISYFAGQIDEFRIVKGKAMYTTNFTPPTSAYVYQATYSDEVEAFKEYYQMTTRLQMLRGGHGGNGGLGGSPWVKPVGGVGGAGRQNLGGFGGGGAGGSGAYWTVARGGGDGGAISNCEIGGGLQPTIYNTESSTIFTGLVRILGAFGTNGAGGNGISATNSSSGQDTAVAIGGRCNGGGGGGGGGASSDSNYPTARGTSGGNGAWAGGFLCLICKGGFTNNGTIRANGGTGGTGGAGGGSAYGGGGGGGSGGGVISVYHKENYANNGVIQSNGGNGGFAGTGLNGYDGTVGTSGSVGTISINKI